MILPFTQTSDAEYLSSTPLFQYDGAVNDLPMSEKPRRLSWLTPVRCSLVLLLALIVLWLIFKSTYIISGALMSVIGVSSSAQLLSSPIVCNNPTPMHDWEVYAMMPGRDGHPEFIEYNYDRRTPHMLSLVDIDFRDTRLGVFANGVLIGGTTDFDFDLSVTCGEDLDECLAKGFSKGTFIIPPGKQNVKIIWAGKGIRLRILHVPAPTHTSADRPLHPIQQITYLGRRMLTGGVTTNAGLCGGVTRALSTFAMFQLPSLSVFVLRRNCRLVDVTRYPLFPLINSRPCNLSVQIIPDFLHAP